MEERANPGVAFSHMTVLAALSAITLFGVALWQIGHRLSRPSVTAGNSLGTASANAETPFAAVDMDVDRRADAALTASDMLSMTSAWTNLNSFSNHGGKLLFYHGVSDPWFSAQDTAQYYERMTVDNGGREAVTQWSRMFLVPGMSHCLGGEAALDQFDLLGAVVDWVEKGTAPDAVVATGNAFTGRSRPLCPYPKHAQYRGSGEMEKAESFECRE